MALALDEKVQIVGIDDKNGIDACKVLGIAFTPAVGILISIKYGDSGRWSPASAGRHRNRRGTTLAIRAEALKMSRRGKPESLKDSRAFFHSQTEDIR